MTNRIGEGRTSRINGVQIYFEECFTCGLPIALSGGLLRRFDEQGEVITCALGHRTVRRESDNDQLRRQLRQAQDQVTTLEQARTNLNGMLDAEIKTRQKLEKRIKAGVCPHCRRNFQNLRRHMETKHDDTAA